MAAKNKLVNETEEATAKADAVEEIQAPDTGEDTLADTSTPKKRGRGRPPGSKTGTAKKDAPRRRSGGTRANLDAVSKQVVGMHALIAHMSGIPELQISDPEGKALAEAALAVCDEYGLVLSGKTGAAIQLLAACGMVYAPRLVAIQRRMAAQREAAHSQESEPALDGQRVLM